ncbi:DUF4917 family protein [Acinetobacter sp. ANC 3832]|uniref:DUF4917 family protein n=1 Tax=Acinetobacter sp. ANC 3832 TaxID=1977874 RepID=UPI000A34BF10|nr:DUF4917 family protein [Acinetobacter sp. ANC 3832]OTG94215.1 hypothetical protein B9T35_07355 [Acinetobacter sp. ANC 3832]
MNYQIFTWEEIKTDFSDSSLILGNGASIAIDSDFKYSNLYDYCVEKDYITENLVEVFKKFKTTDFEFVLKLLWHSNFVNNKLGIEDTLTKTVYEDLQNALINAVKDLHPQYEESIPLKSYNFIKQFHTIITLNYDLILYWIMMYGNSLRNTHAFKDCFNNTTFVDDWESYRAPIYNQREVSLCFFPHGNLSLVTNINNETYKISGGEGQSLISSITSTWARGYKNPLFVSEGDSSEKLRTIQSNPYLSTVYNEVLPSLIDTGSGNIVIYGWSLDDNDAHILKQVFKYCQADTKLAISINNHNQERCIEFIGKINRLIAQDKRPTVIFFDAASSGCWNKCI